jgi:hypothetical protein
MDKLTIKWIKDQLSNNEYASDEELLADFIEGGVPESEAQAWLAKRWLYSLHIVMQDDDGNDIGIYDPRSGRIKPLPDDNAQEV